MFTSLRVHTAKTWWDHTSIPEEHLTMVDFVHTFREIHMDRKRSNNPLIIHNQTESSNHILHLTFVAMVTHTVAILDIVFIHNPSLVFFTWVPLEADMCSRAKDEE